MIMRVRPETWYWVRWTHQKYGAELLPALPYFDEHGEVQHWDSYHGRIGWVGHSDTVEPLEEIQQPRGT